MLGRQILGYTPSLAIPALAAFGAVYCYTRLLEPYQYGYYALALNTMTVLMAAGFYWLQAPVLRLLPQAELAGRADRFRSTIYVVFAVAAALLLLGGLLFIGLVPLADLTTVAMLILPLALARSLLNINQSINRSLTRITRYNLAECGQAVLGLAIGLVLVSLFGLRDHGAIIGLLTGIVLVLLLERSSLRGVSPREFDRAYMTEAMQFGLPMVVPYGLALVLSLSDRFILQVSWGAEAVGIFAVGYTLMDRLVTTIFYAVVTPALPLTIRRLEQEGVAAAREQTYANGAAALVLAVPAVAGLIACIDQVTALVVGVEFQEGARQVMPWLGVSALLAALSSQYFDHAFHLAKRPRLLLAAKAPAAVCSIGLNLVLIPRFGYMGAAYSAVVAYAVMLVVTAVLARRVFPIKFPVVPAVKIAVATAVMVLALQVPEFGTGWSDLISMIVLGGAVYLAMVLLLDVVGARQKVRAVARRHLVRIRPARRRQ
jgi:O-antigen/teichoic acid export membrane protein